MMWKSVEVTVEASQPSQSVHMHTLTSDIGWWERLK